MSNEELTAEEIEELEKKPKTILVKHEFSAQTKDKENPEDLKKRLQQREDQLALIALREFETEKEKLLEFVPADKREEIEEFCDTPEKLETLKKVYDVDEDDETSTKTAPKGKATLPIKTGTETPSFEVETPYNDAMINKISDLYRVIEDPKSSQAEKDKANRILDEMFYEIRKGLKSRGRGTGDYQLPYGIIQTCIKCGKAVEVDITKNPCPHCGHRFGKDPTPTKPYMTPK